jgi:hypothetical protein
MTRTGHPRARRAVRDHRMSALAAAFMLLLALGASLLVSAGSPHHHEHGDVAVAAADTGDPVAQPASHDHRHGNDWTPTLGHRLRPAATIALVGIVAARPTDRDPLRSHRVTDAAPPGFGDGLTALGILRI